MNLSNILELDWVKTLIYMIILSGGLTIGYINLLKMVNDIYKKKVKEFLYENADDMINKLDKKTMNILLIISKSLPLESIMEKYNKQDEFVEERNNNLQIMMRMWLIGLVILLVLAWKKEKMLYVLLEVGIVYIIVGLVIYRYLKDDLMKYGNILMNDAGAFKNIA